MTSLFHRIKSLPHGGSRSDSTRAVDGATMLHSAEAKVVEELKVPEVQMHEILGFHEVALGHKNAFVLY